MNSSYPLRKFYLYTVNKFLRTDLSSSLEEKNTNVQFASRGSLVKCFQLSYDPTN